MADCDVAGEGNHFVHPKYQLRNAVRWLIGAILLIGIASIAFLVDRSGKLSGRIVYVKNVYGGYGGVYSMDPEGNDVTNLTSSCIIRPIAPAWSPDGKLIAFGCHLADDTPTLCVMGEEGMQRPDCFKYTGWVDPERMAEEFCTSSLDAVSWAPDGQRLAIACPYQSTPGDPVEERICIITLAGGGNCWPVSKISAEVLTGGDASVDWSPVEDRLALSLVSLETGYQTLIYLVDPDGRNSVLLAEGRDPSWSPDGGRLAFFRNGMYLIDQDGSNLEPVYQFSSEPPVHETPFWDQNPDPKPGFTSKASWSPNGRFAAFSGSLSPSGGHLGIYIVDLKTKEVWRITDFYDGAYSDPDWSFGD